MKITKQQLRQVIKEALPAHLQKHFRKDGSSIFIIQPFIVMENTTIPVAKFPEKRLAQWLHWD